MQPLRNLRAIRVGPTPPLPILNAYSQLTVGHVGRQLHVSKFRVSITWRLWVMWVIVLLLLSARRYMWVMWVMVFRLVSFKSVSICGSFVGHLWVIRKTHKKAL